MPLNRRDIIQLASMIEERRDALREEIRREVARGREESYAELAGGTHDRGEEALADLVADLGNAEVTRDLEELRGLEAALRRIAAAASACAPIAAPTSRSSACAPSRVQRAACCARRVTTGRTGADQHAAACLPRPSASARRRGPGAGLHPAGARAGAGGG